MEHNSAMEYLEDSNNTDFTQRAEADEDGSVVSEKTFSSSLSLWDELNVNKYADCAVERIPAGRSPSPSIFDLKVSRNVATPDDCSSNSSFCEFRNWEQQRRNAGDAASFKTSWKISPEKPCCNFFVLSSKLVSDEDKECKTITIPAEVSSLISELHAPKSEDTQRIVSNLFAKPYKRYTYGSFFRVHPDVWAVFWDPQRVPELTTLTIQSFICAALNSRRRLIFALGVAANSKIIGCEWNEETRQIMKKQFNFCVNREFVPALDDDIVHFRFYPVCDEEGCDIPQLYIAVISINDMVEEVYQLSSGRFYYANGKNVMQTSSISEVVKRITRYETQSMDGRQRSGTVLRWTPCLGDSIDPDESFTTWFISRVALYGLPGFVITLLLYKNVSVLLR